MKLARLICPRCHTPYQLAVEPGALTVRCPLCGQNNPIPPTRLPLSGRCLRCNRPLDDHGYVGGQLATCPQALA